MAQGKATPAKSDDVRTWTAGLDHLDFRTRREPHFGEPVLNLSPAEESIDNHLFAREDEGERHDRLPLDAAFAADAVELHFVIEKREAMQKGDPPLQCLHLRVVELRHLTALGADEVIMVPAKVSMLVLDLLSFEAGLLGKAVAAEEIEGLGDEGDVQVLPPCPQSSLESSNAHVLRSSKKCLQHLKALVTLLQSVLSANGEELVSFPLVKLLHERCHLFSIRGRSRPGR